MIKDGTRFTGMITADNDTKFFVASDILPNALFYCQDQSVKVDSQVVTAIYAEGVDCPVERTNCFGVVKDVRRQKS